MSALPSKELNIFPGERRFIFFREDGRAFWTADEPNAEDFEHAGIGLMTIVRLADFHVFARGGQWQPLGEGELVRTNVETPSPPYHAPKNF